MDFKHLSKKIAKIHLSIGHETLEAFLEHQRGQAVLERDKANEPGVLPRELAEHQEFLKKIKENPEKWLKEHPEQAEDFKKYKIKLEDLKKHPEWAPLRRELEEKDFQKKQVAEIVKFRKEMEAKWKKEHPDEVKLKKKFPGPTAEEVAKWEAEHPGMKWPKKYEVGPAIPTTHFQQPRAKPTKPYHGPWTLDQLKKKQF